MNHTYTPQTIAKIEVVGYKNSYGLLDSNFILNKTSYTTLNSTLNPENTEQRDFIGAGVFLFGGLIGLLIGLGIGYGSKSLALSLETQRELNKKEMGMAGLGTVLDKEEKISSNKCLTDLLDDNGEPMVGKETSRYFLEAYKLDLSDKETVGYVLEKLIEEGYEPTAEERLTDEAYSTINMYRGTEENPEGGPAKNPEEPDSAKAREASAEEGTKEADLDSEAPAPEGE